MNPAACRQSAWRRQLYHTFFDSDSPRVRMFDKILIVAILLSVLTVTLESVQDIRRHHEQALHTLDWGLTLLFSVEYLLRLLSAPRPLRYARSFYGLVDLMAILPQYLALIFPQSRFLTSIRLLRLLRMFRVFKLTRYATVAHSLTLALRASRRKITVFLLVVMMLAVVLGSLMYVIEGEANGFTSIPVGIYWAIVTLTTVGFGDITPKTPLGQALASVVMVMGYGIIAVPTGIVSAEIVRTGATPLPAHPRQCPSCFCSSHDDDAHYCKQCGGPLPSPVPATDREPADKQKPCGN